MKGMIILTIKEIIATSDYAFSSLLPSPDDFSCFEKIIHEVISLYEEYFGVHPKYFELINDYSNNEYPMTIRSASRIYVHCPLFYPPQFIYQFTHELCHWMIPGDVVPNLRWFEESIAIASSWFFSEKITIYDTDSISEYICRTKVLDFSLNTSELFVGGSSLIQDLENNRNNFTDYPKYSCIALPMLPLIKKNPLFWHSVPKLCDVPEGLSFQKSLEYWKGLLPSTEVSDAFSQVIRSLQ